MDKKEIVSEIMVRIDNYNKNIKTSGEGHLWRAAHELTIARDALIGLLAAIGEL